MGGLILLVSIGNYKLFILRGTMQQSDIFEVQILEEDRCLNSLFASLEEIRRVGHQSVSHPITEQPSHYDLKDIEKDYLSDCPPTRKPPRKNKKRKMIVNTAAKIKRQRKNKLYIEMLENRIFELQKEIEILRRANNNTKKSLKKNSDSEQIVNGFFVNRQRHYEKLVAMTKQTNIDEKRFIQEYNILRIRQGAVGKDRIKVVNYYFRELSEIMLPDLQKYIMKTAEEQTDLFDPNFSNNGALGSYVEQWRKDMILDLQLSFEKISRITELKGQIIVQKRKMEDYFKNFYEFKCKIVEASRKIQMTYDRLNNILSPRQIAKCLCLIEKYKSEKGFSVENIFWDTFSKLDQEQKQIYDLQHLYQST